MNKYVYEVVTTNILTGAKDSTYFSSMIAAKRWKDSQEKGQMVVATICQWRMFNNKDI